MTRLIAAMAVLVATAPATTLPRSTTRDLTRKAERVCCAVCESVEARKDPRTGFVFTHVRLRLLEDMKGRGAGSTIELRLIGGEAGGSKTVVPGMPRFTKGKESVLLLGPRNAHGFPVVMQATRGVIHLRRGKSGTRYLGARVTGFKELKGKSLVSLSDFRQCVKRETR